ncbi:SOS response-associated peptidase [Massilia litorea]|jgi:putative SOS response-associated peptidase YedK|uniref:Abasic site processing protein n=1 Tax=Massilia litorea TaxID=2769491 RepID=A0A7L9U0T8_9BURK|nr:SOS response-associated peptidase family protein [Massilia litorea]QOL48558.1 SOS response-associated peptidase family protein [Massilia litorea]
MCVNYRPPTPEQFGTLGAFSDLPADWRWPEETWKDYLAPILRLDADGRPSACLASYGMVPRRQIPPEIKPFDTMNARAESLGERRSFAPAWRRLQLCAVPMAWFYEPCYESGRAVRHAIGMQDESLFYVAGLWRDWPEADGTVTSSFTQITINADEHALMRRMHKPDDEKRSLVILPHDEVNDWLACTDLELARSFLRHYPAENMRDWPAPPVSRKAVETSPNFELF